MRRIVAVLLVGLACSLPASAQDCPPVSAASGPRTANVLELYTSEGCSSCPPADRWLSSLRTGPDVLVPLAFHVDYWDAIGWADRFAQPAFAGRQREAVRRQRSRVAYTPQVLVDGRDLGDWFRPRALDAAAQAVAARTPVADLTLRAVAGADALDADLQIRWRQQAAPAVAAYLVITEDRLESRVNAGENRGAILRHDYVVRRMLGPFAPPSAPATATSWPVTQRITIGRDWKRADLAISAFVQRSDSGEMLQAVRLPLCGNPR